MDTLTIVGVGLIGASLGLATKKRGLARRVRGVGRKQSSLDRARSCGAVDETCLDIPSAMPGSDVVVVCTPVDKIAEHILTAAFHCAPGTLLTDAGSTKAVILADVEPRLPPRIDFIGSHPLAGSEKRGPEYGDADLFEDRWVVVTRSARSDAKALDRTVSFWRALGARVAIMTPDDHDRALALTSHVPHIVASALAAVLPEATSHLAASGFRDTTRIAAGDPGLWTAICVQNTRAILSALDTFELESRRYRDALEANDWTTLESLFSHAKKVRDALGS